MAVERIGEIFECKICGNEVRVSKVGGGTLVCCEQEMKEKKAPPVEPVNLPDSGG